MNIAARHEPVVSIWYLNADCEGVQAVSDVRLCPKFRGYRRGLAVKTLTELLVLYKNDSYPLSLYLPRRRTMKLVWALAQEMIG